MFELTHEMEITINDIPLPWISKIEIYYPDLPQFPILYIHTHAGGQRIIACPVSVNYNINATSCDATFTVLSNVESNDFYRQKIQAELAERIGVSNKISINDIVNCCNGNDQYISLFTDLWQYIQSSYGAYIPYGKFYEEVFSIVRFVSAWQPKTGRQSEMRMLYNFMSAFGEKVTLTDKWKHLEFFAIPTLQDISNNCFFEFPTFSILDSAMRKLFDEFFIADVTIYNTDFKVMQSAWGRNKDSFICNVTEPLFRANQLTEDEKLNAEKLVDAFNRHSWRAAYFISSYINIQSDYAHWSKQFFMDFYTKGNKFKGYSEKVVACFLQQGFLNPEVVPIDTWIKTFYEFPLGIDNNNQFFNSFSNLGKLERVIWLASQSNKTNMRAFFDVLWCQRYGVNGNTKLRGVNPISCYSCKLKNTCVGVSNKNEARIYLLNNHTNEDLSEIFTQNPEIAYICTLDNGIPKKCYIQKNLADVLIDEFSGYLLTAQDRLPQAMLDRGIVSFREFVSLGR